MNSDFYITLPSNTKTESDNTTGNFSVQLPKKIYLQGNWEIALAEIQYPHSWNNIFGQQPNRMADNWIDVTFANNYLMTVFVPPGHYGSIIDLVMAIEYGKQNASQSLINTFAQPDIPEEPDNKNEFQLLKKHVKDVYHGFQFEFDQTLKRIKCKKDPSKIKHLELSEKLQYMLGFEKPGILADKSLAKFIPDLRGGFYSLYVYCSLVEPQIVGDITAPLLRNVHIKGTHGDIIEKLFNNPHYLPVNAKEIDRIDIHIMDDHNQSVPFQFGKTVVKLHFRKKKYNLL